MRNNLANRRESQYFTTKIFHTSRSRSKSKRIKPEKNEQPPKNAQHSKSSKAEKVINNKKDFILLQLEKKRFKKKQMLQRSIEKSKSSSKAKSPSKDSLQFKAKKQNVKLQQDMRQKKKSNLQALVKLRNKVIKTSTSKMHKTKSESSFTVQDSFPAKKENQYIPPSYFNKLNINSNSIKVVDHSIEQNFEATLDNYIDQIQSFYKIGAQESPLMLWEMRVSWYFRYYLKSRTKFEKILIKLYENVQKSSKEFRNIELLQVKIKELSMQNKQLQEELRSLQFKTTTTGNEKHNRKEVMKIIQTEIQHLKCNPDALISKPIKLLYECAQVVQNIRSHKLIKYLTDMYF